MSGPTGIDPDAIRYDTHWRPVLESATSRLLDRLDLPVQRHLGAGGEPPLLLDLGTGTGSLLVEAGRRWPGLRLVALDATRAMLGLARQRAAETGLAIAARDQAWLASEAESIPLEDGIASVVASSFMLQLVRDRAAVLDEVRRILEPEGTFGFVTWIAEDSRFDADEAFDEAVYELELDDPDPGFRCSKAGDFESVQAAADELSAAGFGTVDARPDQILHTWTREGFLAFKQEYDELDLFDSLEAEAREALLENVRRRYAALSDEAFVLRAPLVRIVATV